MESASGPWATFLFWLVSDKLNKNSPAEGGFIISYNGIGRIDSLADIGWIIEEGNDILPVSSPTFADHRISHRHK